MTHRLFPTAVALGAATAIAIAGCGSSGNSSTGSTGASGGSSASSSSGGYGGSTTSGGGRTTAGAKTAATISTAKSDLGTILVDGKGRTIYLWVADTGDQSTCYDACAVAWPPVLTHGAPKAGGGADASLLGTTKRTDGTTEVTYAGHPLYLYIGDKAPGDTTGQASEGFGAYWWVMDTSGKAITTGGEGS